ncbi:22123_t:CDS:2, partial [Racocetra persica]
EITQESKDENTELNNLKKNKKKKEVILELNNLNEDYLDKELTEHSLNNNLVIIFQTKLKLETLFDKII